ncbi:hypothetical protein XENOCAPTIV_030930 [Xenoophorus captivus]|uniref:Secreted protein n=1 Tax=Xenoophorus captivus TaxID=1517983 RepID=A0ABV0RUQ3_9TELE
MTCIIIFFSVFTTGASVNLFCINSSSPGAHQTRMVALSSQGVCLYLRQAPNNCKYSRCTSPVLQRLSKEFYVYSATTPTSLTVTAIATFLRLESTPQPPIKHSQRLKSNKHTTDG